MNQSKTATSLHNIKERLHSNHKVMNPTAKLALWICDILGITSMALGWVTNLANINSAILAIIGISWGSVRLYFYIRKHKIAIRREELEQQIREWEWKQRLHQHDQDKL